MLTKKSSLFLSFLVVNLLTFASHTQAAEIGYQWEDKLGRGVLNMVGSPVELARTIHIQSRAKGAGYGWTMGLVEGLGRTLLRFGSGAIETVTFPFDFPKGDKSPLLMPAYPWDKWDVEYL